MTTTSLEQPVADGIHAMVLLEKMTPTARLFRDTYTITPGAPFYHREFGYYCLEQWYEQGLDRNANLSDVFGYHVPGNVRLTELGWCEAAFSPVFEDKVLEDRGEHEVVQDFAGRHVLVFKGRRSGFMPEYIDHPVKDMKSWKENVKWRLDPTTPGRMKVPQSVIEAAATGHFVSQRAIGGYMYLRSLIGPEQLLYFFYDEPELIHDCMKTWLKLADAQIAFHQKYVTIDEIFLAEDICYNNGSLISPAFMEEFLIPYYQQLIQNIKARQLDKSRKLFVQIDTDGYANDVIPIYQKGIGMDVMSPFEVASGSDVVEIGKQFPNLVLIGGIDKRILAEGKREIDVMVERILPAMRARGGYIPTCDHGVPEEVPLENYLHYRKRCLEIGGAI
jgi:uroporphyrinogen decarboxylase